MIDHRRRQVYHRDTRIRYYTPSGDERKPKPGHMTSSAALVPKTISASFGMPEATQALWTTIAAGRAHTEALMECTNSLQRAATQQYPRKVITKPRAWMQTLLVTGRAKRVSQEVWSDQQGRAEDDESDPQDEDASGRFAHPCAYSTHNVSFVPRPWRVARVCIIPPE